MTCLALKSGGQRRLVCQAVGAWSAASRSGATGERDDRLRSQRCSATARSQAWVSWPSWRSRPTNRLSMPPLRRRPGGEQPKRSHRLSLAFNTKGSTGSTSTASPTSARVAEPRPAPAPAGSLLQAGRDVRRIAGRESLRRPRYDLAGAYSDSPLESPTRRTPLASRPPPDKPATHRPHAPPALRTPPSQHHR